MSIQKPLCRLCECPTADGAVPATQVERNKLRNWAMKAMNLTEEDEYLPEKIEEDCLICYFCIWQAEFADESGDESVAWWPRNLELGVTAKELRRNYSVGKVEQCWVQLEKVEFDEDYKQVVSASQRGPETPEQTASNPDKRMACLYCGAKFSDVKRHAMKMHKDEVIKCFFCRTFFRTVEEREQHTDEKHPNRFSEQCDQCEFAASTAGVLAMHVRSKHGPNVSSKRIQCKECDARFVNRKLLQEHEKEKHWIRKCVNCDEDIRWEDYLNHMAWKRCVSCKGEFRCAGKFQTHLPDCREVRFDCPRCPDSFLLQQSLDRHVETEHPQPEAVIRRLLRCSHCRRSFQSKASLKQHVIDMHMWRILNKGRRGRKRFCPKPAVPRVERCDKCSLEVPLERRRHHQRPRTCRRCEGQFDCFSLFLSHRLVCLKTPLRCDQCPDRTFRFNATLRYHINRRHKNRQWLGERFKASGFKCDPCMRYFRSKTPLRKHVRNMHDESRLRRCAHCPKSFHLLYKLKAHLAVQHDLIERKFECDFCKKKFYVKYTREMHVLRSHLGQRKGVPGQCHFCGKQVLNLYNHLLMIHGTRPAKLSQSDVPS